MVFVLVIFGSCCALQNSTPNISTPNILSFFSPVIFFPRRHPKGWKSAYSMYVAMFIQWYIMVSSFHHVKNDPRMEWRGSNVIFTLFEPKRTFFIRIFTCFPHKIKRGCNSSYTWNSIGTGLKSELFYFVGSGESLLGLLWFQAFDTLISLDKTINRMHIQTPTTFQLGPCCKCSDCRVSCIIMCCTTMRIHALP